MVRCHPWDNILFIDDFKQGKYCYLLNIIGVELIIDFIVYWFVCILIVFSRMGIRGKYIDYIFLLLYLVIFILYILMKNLFILNFDNDILILMDEKNNNINCNNFILNYMYFSIILIGEFFYNWN